MKNLSKLSSQFGEAYGPQYINLPEIKDFSDEQPIFIFDFFACTERLKYHITQNICEQSGLNPQSYDIIYVDGQDDLIKKDALSFWFWDKTGLIPFAFIGQDAHKGSLENVDGVLFLNANKAKSFDKLPVVYYSVKNISLESLDKRFKDLNIRIIQGDREASESLKAEGNALVGEGDIEAAIHKYHEALAIDSSNPAPYNNLGMVIDMKEDHHNQSEFFYQIALIKDPKDTNTMRGISGTLIYQNDFDAAITIMKKACELDRSPHNLMILSRTAFVCKEYELALQSCNEGLEIVPDDEEFLEMQETIEDKMEELEDVNDYDEDEAEGSIFSLVLRMLDTQVSQDDFYQSVLSLDDNAESFYPMAIGMAQQAHAEEPTLDRTVVLARTAFACKDFDYALQTCQDGLSMDPQQADLLDLQEILQNI